MRHMEDEDVDDDGNDSFDPEEFYRQQQQAMLLQASQHVEQTRDEIQRVQQEADEVDTGKGGRRPRRSAANAASAAMTYQTQSEGQVDSVYFGTRKMGPPPKEISSNFQAPSPPKPKPPVAVVKPPRAATRGRARGGGRAPKPKRDWGGDDDEETPEYTSTGSTRGKGRGGGAGGRRSGHTMEDENSLYFIVRTGRASLQQTVDDWVEEYKVDKDSALLKLMQFFISASGCKGKVTSEMQADMEHTDIIRKMTEEFDEDSADYPLVTPGQFWKKFRSNFCDFVGLLVKQCQYSIIYDQYLMDSVISLLTQLSDSQVRPFRHTSTLAALQLMTALVDVALTVSINLDNTVRQYDSERAKAKDKRASDRLEVLMTKRRELEENMEEIKNMLTYMFKAVFVLRYRDIVPAIRSSCMHEIGIWMKKFHQMFLDDTYLKYIGWTLHDKVGDVRLKCLQSLQPLYSSEELKNKLDLFTSKFKDRIVSMTLDKEVEVAVEAVKLVTSILKYHPDILSEKDCEHIYELVYSSHRLVGQAAGEFLKEKFFLPDEEAVVDLRTKRGKTRLPNTPLVRDLVQFFIESELHEHGAYLVDSLIESNPMMKDWECMTDLLLEEPGPQEEDLDDKQETSLIEIMVCCIRQAATCEPPIGRGTAGKKVLSTKENKQITEDKIALTSHFITTLPRLLHKYKVDADKLSNLLVIPQYFDLEIYTTSRQEKALESLLKLMQEIVERNSASEVLKAAAQTLEKMCNKEFAIYGKCDINRSRILDMITNNYKESMDAYTSLLDGDERPNDDETFAVVSSLKKIAYFHNCHDMSRLNIWDNLHENLVASWEAAREDAIPPLPMEAVKYCIDSCFYGLMWAIVPFQQEGTDRGDLEEARSELKEQMEKFMDICEKMIRDCPEQSWKEQAYAAVGDLLIYYGPGDPIKFRASSQMCQTLNKFVQEYVFINDTDEDIDDHEKIEELHKRRNFLAGYCKLPVYRVVPTQYGSYVLQHYVTFYNDFGDIMKMTLSRLRDNHKVNCAKAMLQALILKFESLHDGNDIDRNGDDFHAIKELSKRFALSFGLDAVKNREAVTKLHRLGIEYAVDTSDKDDASAPPSNLSFLELVTEFTNKLLKQDKKVLLDYLDRRVTGGIPSTRSEAWAPLHMYRNSLVHGEGGELISMPPARRAAPRKRRRSGDSHSDDDDPEDQDFTL